MKKILKLIIITLLTLLCTQYTFAYSSSEHSISNDELELLAKLDLDSFWKPNSSAINITSLEHKYKKKSEDLKSDYSKFISILTADCRRDYDLLIVETYNELVKKIPLSCAKISSRGD